MIEKNEGFHEGLSFYYIMNKIKINTFEVYYMKFEVNYSFFE